jgi:hypothetical protein
MSVQDPFESVDKAMANDETKNGKSSQGRRLPRYASRLIKPGGKRKATRFGLSVVEKSCSVEDKPKKLPSEDLERFQRGEITEEQYLEARIDVAIAHLHGRVSIKRLVMVREVVRDMLDNDPVLVAMREWVLRGKRPSG